MAGASEVRVFSATCPSGTALATPVTVSLAMPTRQVNAIRIRIPPGPNGVMGFAIGSAGQPIFPSNGGFIVASDEIIEWDLSGEINSGAWEIRMYNTGFYSHTVYLQFECELPDIPGVQSSVQPVTVVGPSVTDGTTIPPIDTTLPDAPELT